MQICIPNAWNPRPYQRRLWDYFAKGGRRAVAVWHRRCGKDSLALNLEASKALTERVGVYWHMLPLNTQARKVIWDGVDRYGRRMIDQAFPKELRQSTNDQEMKIVFKTGRSGSASVRTTMTRWWVQTRSGLCFRNIR